MLRRILGLLSPRRRRTLLAERLLISVEQLGSMIFDRTLVAQLGVGRKLGIKLACHLALKERIHMLTDPNGRVVLMSNMEYERYTERRARGERETEIRVRDGVKSIVVKDFDADGGLPLLIDTVCVEKAESPPRLLVTQEESDTALFTSPPLLGNASDNEWFNIDIVETGTDGASAKSAPERQSLPERKREPWSSTDIHKREGK